MSKLCLFDLDGTLTDPIDGITNAFVYALKLFEIEITDKYALAKYIGPPLRDSFLEIGIPQTQIEDAVSKYREYFTVTGLFENTMYLGIMDMLAELSDSGIVMAIATSKVADYAEIIAEHFGFNKYFDFIAGGELDGTRSQKSEVIIHALNNIDPERKMSPIMVGDRKYDIIGAKEVGVECIGVTWGYGSLDELRLAGATRIASSPKELCDLILSL